MSLSIFVSGDGKDRKNGSLEVVDVAILSQFEKLSHTIQIWEVY